MEDVEYIAEPGDFRWWQCNPVCREIDLIISLKIAEENKKIIKEKNVLIFED